MTIGNTHDISLGLPGSAVRPAIIPTAAQERIAIYLSARALLVFVFMLIIFTLAARQIIDPDFWWHLRTGQYLVETHSIPRTDVFSTVFFGKEWITHEWLSEVLIYSVYQALGFGGLIVTFSLLITAGFAVSYRRSAGRAGHVYITGSAVLLGALAAGPTWGVRPQVFSFLLAAIFLYLLERYQEQKRNPSIWWLVPLMGLWVNLHAGFAVGLVLILVVIMGTVLEALLLQRQSFLLAWQSVRSLVLVLISCCAAVILNPSGARMYSYPFETLTSQAMMKFIEEWRTPNFHELMFQPLALFMLAVFSALAFSGKRMTLTQLLLLLSTAWAMLRSGRNAPFFILVAVPLLAEHSWIWLTSQTCGRSLTRPEAREVGASALVKIVLNIMLLVIMPLALVAVRVQRAIANQPAIEAQKFPSAALDFIGANKLPQPLYNEYHWGGYLIWKLYPSYRVFIDGRADVYGDAFFQQFMATHAGEPNWQDLLNKYGVRTVLLTPDAALASLLRQDNNWQKVFEDSQAVIFTRR